MEVGKGIRGEGEVGGLSPGRCDFFIFLILFF